LNDLLTDVKLNDAEIAYQQQKQNILQVSGTKSTNALKNEANFMTN